MPGPIRRRFEEAIAQQARPPPPHAVTGAVIIVVALAAFATALWLGEGQSAGWLMPAMVIGTAVAVIAGIILMRWEQGSGWWEYVGAAMGIAMPVVGSVAFSFVADSEMEPCVWQEGAPVPWTKLHGDTLEGTWMPGALGMGTAATDPASLPGSAQAIILTLRYETILTEQVHVKVLAQQGDTWGLLAEFDERVAAAGEHNFTVAGHTSFMVVVEPPAADTGGSFTVDWEAYGRNGTPGATCQAPPRLSSSAPLAS